MPVSANDWATQIAQTVREPVLWLDESMRVKAVNSAFCRAFQLSRGDVAGHSFFDLMHGEHNAPGLRTLLQATFSENRRVEDLEIEVTFESIGHKRLVMNASRIQLKDREPLILVAIEESVTFQGRQFARPDDQILELMEYIHAAFWIFDFPVRRMAYVSPAYAEIWDRSVQELYERPDAWLDAVHPADREGVCTAVVRSERGERVEHEFRITSHQEAERWIRLRTFPVKDNQEQLRQIVAIAFDVTPHKLAEQALRQSEERFSKAFYTSPAPMSITTFERRYLSVNDSWLQLFGFRREEVIGHTPMELGLWVNREDRSQLMEQLRADGQLRDVEIQLRTKQGKVLDLLLSVETIQLNGQDHWLFLTYNITDRKRAEQQAIELAIEHEKTQLLKDFISDASHEFRTPMTVLKLSIHLLHELASSLVLQVAPLRHLLENAPSETVETQLIDIRRTANAVRQQVDRMDNNTEALQRLIETLLELSKLDKRPAFEFDCGDLNSLIRKVLERQLPIAVDKGVNVRFEPLETMPSVPLDDYEFTHVVQNLVDNAIRYTPAGGTVTIRTGLIEQQVLFEVSDTGIGIPEADVPHIFERFYRVDKQDTNRTGGMGLGLAIVQRIVQAHSGRIEVESRPEIGSVFRVYLPAGEC